MTMVILLRIDVEIDNLTPCLAERKTGRILETVVTRVFPNKKHYSGWNFDWSISLKNQFEVYALTISGETEIQGMIALKKEAHNCAVHVDIVETAPHNFGKNGQYEGVGAHLFAFACKTAYDNEYEYIYFDAKTNLIGYYKEKLGAVQLGRSQRMMIDGESFMALINAYYGG